VTRATAVPLGELLRRFGLLAEPDLRSALARQANEGGRLGTCLLDVGGVEERVLLAALGAQRGAATVDAAALGDVPEAAAALLPARVALLAKAVPIARSASHLEVAMLDPSALDAVDDLARLTRLTVQPRLALEVRIFEALERLYRIAVSERLERTRRRIARRSGELAVR
jgi:type IV pilus assembly protein PilB